MAFAARFELGRACVAAALLVSLGAGCASQATRSYSVTARPLDDGCSAALASEHGLTTYSAWTGDSLEVTYFAIHNAPMIPDSARIDAVSPSAIALSYEYRASRPGEPIDLCGPVALRFTVKGVPRANYAVEVSSREARQ
jgi:hypothetical protein